jgi:integrase
VRLPADAYLFSEAGDFSRAWRPDVCTNRFGRLRQRVGVPTVRLHDLRHFVATALGAGGTPIATISARLGHRDKATTLNIYSHALPAADRDAADRLGALLGAATAEPSR